MSDRDAQSRFSADRIREALEEIAAARDSERRSHAGFDVVRRERLALLRADPADGGAGLGVRELFRIIIQIARADPDVAHGLRSTFGFVEGMLTSQAPPVRERWLAVMRDGAIVGNATNELSNRPVGAADYRTRLMRTPHGLRLNGRKFYCTGTLYSDLVTVHVTDEQEQPVRAVVPVDRAGIEVIDDWDGIGQRHSGSGTTVFTDVVVHDDEVIPSPVEHAGDDRTVGLAYAQLYLHAVVAGVLHSVVDDAVRLVNGRRRSFAHAPTPLPADDPILQEGIGQIASTAFAAEALVLVAAESLERATVAVRNGRGDAGLAHEASLSASCVKVHIDEAATRAATMLFELGGASAVRRQADLDRHWRNIRTVISHNPAAYKAQAIGAHLVTGAPLPANAFF